MVKLQIVLSYNLIHKYSGILQDKRDSRLSPAPTIKVVFNRVIKKIGAHGIIVVYDVTDKETFRAVDNWMADVDKFASESAIRMIVGNKCDSDDKRKVTFEEGKELAARYNVKFLETSAKNSKGVIDAFQTLSKEIKAKVLPKKTPTASTKTSNANDLNQNSANCWSKEAECYKRKAIIIRRLLPIIHHINPCFIFTAIIILVLSTFFIIHYIIIRCSFIMSQ